MKDIFGIALDEIVANVGGETFVFTVDFNDESYKVNFQYEVKGISCINESGGDLGDSGLMRSIENAGIDSLDAIDYLDQAASKLLLKGE